MIHPCFPIVDKQTFFEMWNRDPQRIACALMCDIYGSALIFWNSSSTLKEQHRPDIAFVWNQAVAALHEDFMAPSLSTLPAALLDMIGRPVLSIPGNVVTAGKTSTLATSLGLHRDPSSWKIAPQEKIARIRLWWGVLIHDHWLVWQWRLFWHPI
jgi:hypothetical protein